jgi:hypothetical protein
MKIDQGARNIAQFFSAMKGVTENIQRQAAINKKEAEQATRRKDAREGQALSKFDKDFAHIQGLTDQIGDFEVGGSKENIQDDAIMENLVAMRDKFLSEIADPDMGSAEVGKITAKFQNQIAIFKQDMDNFVGGYRVYKDIKDKKLGPNEEDAILSDENAPFNEMIPIYESLYTGKGDVGIVPGADGRSFNIGKFNKSEDAEGNITYGQPTIATSLTEYRNYAQKNGPNDPKFFEQVEVFAPGGGSRKAYLDNGINRFKNSAYNFGIKKPVMVKNEKGEMVPKVYVSGQNKGLPVLGGQTLDIDKFEAFTETKEGINFLMEGIKGQNPKSVYVGLGYDPGTFSEQALLTALKNDLINTYEIGDEIVTETAVEDETLDQIPVE